MSKRYSHISGQYVHHDASMHMSLTLIPPNTVVVAANVHVSSTHRPVLGSLPTYQ